MNPRETGNPVFDFRAGYRRGAGAAQTALLTLGVLAPIAGGVLRVASVLTTPQAWLCAGSGVGLFIAGFAWGIYWRRTVRQDFRKQFGPD